jgi:hypothetical protein
VAKEKLSSVCFRWEAAEDDALAIIRVSSAYYKIAG